MDEPATMTGTLYVVATPIGNLDDFSARARDTLARVAVIAAEDTRTSRKLLPARADAVQWIALHDHNESRTVERLLGLLREGRDIALVSDAGTPLISDPGYRLVRAVRAAGITVRPIPGACALIAALSVAGLATDRFWFEGFLPPRHAARRTRLTALADVDGTLGFYVPARDLPAVLGDAVASLGGEREAVVARELTKVFETVLDGTLDDLAARVSDDADQQRGEAVLLIAGRASEAASTRLDCALLARELAAELPPARAARVLTRVTGMARREAFAMVEQAR
ncbi:MAG: 16S rRNA (cytidine(1402)-2'-O)-methyltransferase [Wenzhouxiangellaceae bacterium]|nr:16S rRNA (cytidine(1402)-2'-O)-methyltransferase [Wenzhouxiangellaceae bacterium]